MKRQGHRAIASPAQRRTGKNVDDNDNKHVCLPVSRTRSSATADALCQCKILSTVETICITNPQQIEVTELEGYSCSKQPWLVDCRIGVVNKLYCGYPPWGVWGREAFTYLLISGVCLQCFDLPPVLWRCWLGGRKGIRPVKNWVIGCWHGYLSGARCRLAYGPADATATHSLLLQ